MIGRTFALLTMLDVGDTEVGTLIKTFNTVMTVTANEIFGKCRAVKNPWVTADISSVCVERRELKNSRHGTEEGAKKYRTGNQEESWIVVQSQDGDIVYNSKKACQLVKVLTQYKDKPTPYRTKTGIACEAPHVRKRVDRILPETGAKLYSHIVKGDPEVLNVPPGTNIHKYPILRKGVETAVKSLKKGKSPGIDNIRKKEKL